MLPLNVLLEITCRFLVDGTTYPNLDLQRSSTGSGAQFESGKDGTPRSYRDRQDFSIEGAPLIKSKNTQSMMEVNDLQSGDVTAVTLGPGKRKPRREAGLEVEDSELAYRIHGLILPSRKRGTNIMF
jgi:hypothetical protein